MFNNVVITGSLAFDHIMSMPGRFKDHIMPDKLHILNVSFIMNTFRQEYGGTGGNIAYNLGLLTTPCVLVSAVGNDFTAYKKHLKKIEDVNLSGIKVYRKYKTAHGFVITDSDDNQIWGFYNGAMKMSSKISITPFLDKKCLLVVAPNDPIAMMKYVNEAINLNVPYVFDPAFNITHFKLSNLRKAVRNSHILIGNDYEVTLIQRRLGYSAKELLNSCRLLITTLGPKGSKIESKKKRIVIPAAEPMNESDPTGAGDAYRAGFIAGYIRNFSLETCGRMGALTSVYTVEKYGTQTHKFTLKQFCSRYKKNFNDGSSELKSLKE